MFKITQLTGSRHRRARVPCPGSAVLGTVSYCLRKGKMPNNFRTTEPWQAVHTLPHLIRQPKVSKLTKSKTHLLTCGHATSKLDLSGSKALASSPCRSSRCAAPLSLQGTMQRAQFTAASSCCSVRTGAAFAPGPSRPVTEHEGQTGAWPPLPRAGLP